MLNFVKMEAGDFAWNVAGCLHGLDQWEAYDFIEGKWVSAKKYRMYWANPYPYPNGVSFEDMMKQFSSHLPEDATVYYYDNECFGALRKRV